MSKVSDWAIWTPSPQACVASISREQKSLFQFCCKRNRANTKKVGWGRRVEGNLFFPPSSLLLSPLLLYFGTRLFSCVARNQTIAFCLPETPATQTTSPYSVYSEYIFCYFFSSLFLLFVC